ncbi:salivaricin M family lantibiotic [Streptococcus suis]|uniref:salivaricin M family lantibiotic n=1 Tax=Streptococcus suis TaxID=1307 RepID=UPI00359C587D
MSAITDKWIKLFNNVNNSQELDTFLKNVSGKGLNEWEQLYKQYNSEIDTLDFEISTQELEGTSGAGGWYSAFKMTLAGRCGRCFTCSYECTSNNVNC